MTQYPESNDKVNGQLKSADTDGAPVYSDHMTEKSLRERFSFQAHCQRV